MDNTTEIKDRWFFSDMIYKILDYFTKKDKLDTRDVKPAIVNDDIYDFFNYKLLDNTIDEMDLSSLNAVADKFNKHQLLWVLIDDIAELDSISRDTKDIIVRGILDFSTNREYAMYKIKLAFNPSIVDGKINNLFDVVHNTIDMNDF